MTSIKISQQRRKTHWPSWLKDYDTPAYRQIGKTVRRNLRLFLISLSTNLLAAGFEATTLSVIFLALGILESEDLPNFQNTPIAWLPGAADSLASLSQQQVFAGLILLAVALQVLRSVVTYISLVSAGYLAARVKDQMTVTIFERIISFSFACASRYKVGDLTSYVSKAGMSVQTQMQLWSQLLSVVTMSLAYLVTILLISVRLSLVAVMLFSLIVVLQRWLLPRIREASKQFTKAQVEVSKDVVENIQALRVVHTFGVQDATVARIQELQKSVLQTMERQARLISVTSPVNSALTIILIAGLLTIGSFLLGATDTAVVPALVTFIVALNRLSIKLQGVAAITNQLANNSGQIARLDAVLHTSDKEFTRQGGKDFDGLRSDIYFDRVWLQYDGVETPSVADLSFKMPKNTVTALVGESGAGKSSIIDLMIGLYQPTRGRILVDGVNLETYSSHSWKKKLGVVSQDTFIFNQSILENIRYGMSEATDDQVVEAAKLAQAHEFIDAMPGGYGTTVGERGYRLSGGQRQRIALARAILKQPELLILDEATSALDSRSERLVQEALGQFEKNRTVLVVAHRLSTIVHADQILVLEKGRLVERGNHEELLALGGKYASYWAIQSAAA